MKLTDLFESQISPEAYAQLIRAISFFTSNYQRDYPEAYAVIEQAINQMPQFLYTGELYRCVQVYGSKARALSTLRRNPLAKGLQSWSKSEQGVERWMDDLGDLEETVTDIYLKQTGKGLDFAKVYQYGMQNKDQLSPEAVEGLEEIKRAVEVEEVAAPYNKSVQIYKTQTHDVEWDDM